MNKRDTYKYHIKQGNKILHTGITNDLERREFEHQLKHGNKASIHQVGHAVTRKSAFKWEAEQRIKGKPTGP